MALIAAGLAVARALAAAAMIGGGIPRTDRSAVRVQVHLLEPLPAVLDRALDPPPDSRS